MAKRIVATDFSLVRTLLLGTTALALVASHRRGAKIGVTSATDGDPLGKPPTENERVLRIGIDVQANEVVTTKTNDRAHLVFLDGTSITVGPNAQLKLDKFVYDPNTKKGEMALTASKGVLRLVGGKISKTNAITIATPSSTIGIRGGITILSVSPTQTVSTFVFGNSLTVSGAGATQTITRPGTPGRHQLRRHAGQSDAGAAGRPDRQPGRARGQSQPGRHAGRQRRSAGAEFRLLEPELGPAAAPAAADHDDDHHHEHDHQRGQQQPTRAPTPTPVNDAPQTTTTDTTTTTRITDLRRYLRQALHLSRTVSIATR